MSRFLFVLFIILTPLTGLAAPTVLITGGARGLGLEITKKYIEKDYTVIIAARTPPTDEAVLKNPNVRYIPFDASDLEAMASKTDEIFKSVPKIDVVILNAGLTLVKDISDQTELELLKVMQTNFLGAAFLTNNLIKRSPHEEMRVIYISSAGAILPRPGFSAYSASKAAAENYFLSLHDELQQGQIKNIKVSIVRPAFIRSEYPVNIQSDQAKTVDFMDALRSFSPTTSETVSNLVVRTSEALRPAALINVGLDGKLLNLSAALLPRPMMNWLQGKVQSLTTFLLNSAFCKGLLKPFRSAAILESPGRTPASQKIHFFMSVYPWWLDVMLVGDQVKETVEFLFDFMIAMKSRADEINKDPEKVEKKLIHAGFFSAYEKPSSNSKCDGFYKGEIAINGSLVEFIDLWNHHLSIKYGSINDRMYADIVAHLLAKAQGISLLNDLQIDSKDSFTIEMNNGLMMKMNEKVIIKKVGFTLSETDWTYRRTVEPRGRNSFEESLANLDCDPARVSEFYNRIFNPLNFNKGFKIRLKFSMENKLNSDPFDSNTTGKEFSHFFDFTGIGPLL